MTLARRLSMLRERSNLSLDQVASAVGRSKAHMWNLENGVANNPSLRLLTQLARHYGVRIADLVGEGPGGEPDDSEAAALARALRELDARDRELVRTLIDALGQSRRAGRRTRVRAARGRRTRARA